MSRSQRPAGQRRFQQSQSRQRYQPGAAAPVDQLVDVLDDGSLVLANVDGIDFGSNLSVTDNGDGTVTVDASGGGGGGFVADPVYDIENQTWTDQGMSDDFSDGSLDAQWTANGMSAGTIDLFTEKSSSIYEERGNRGTLFVQMAPGSGHIGFRVDQEIQNGEEVVVAAGPGATPSGSNNDFNIGIAVNDDDTSQDNGTRRWLYYDGEDNGNIKVWDGNNVLRTLQNTGAIGRRVYFRLTRLSDTFYFSFSANGAAWAMLQSFDATTTTYDNFWIWVRHADGLNSALGAVGSFYWVRHAATNGEYDPFTA